MCGEGFVTLMETSVDDVVLVVVAVVVIIIITVTS
jgi:hypothetical protein